MPRIGPYEVVGELGRGGMGLVFRVRDPASGEVCALKLMTPSAGAPARDRRFAREVAALRRLRHPHVVPIRDAGEDAGRPYLVMELVEGVTLEERLERGGPLAPGSAAALVLALARALEHAHAQGVLHRDLKPANVLLGPGERPSLTDFGLARRIDTSLTRLTRSGMALGTPGYWPPEQAVGELDRVGPASDVYGLGAVLYAALTRLAPAAGESLVEVLRATCERPPDPPSAHAPDVPPALDAICLRCLEKEPERRYASAAALAEDLERFLAGEPLAVTSPPARRRALLRVLGGLALVTAAGAVGVSSWPPPAPPPVSSASGAADRAGPVRAPASARAPAPTPPASPAGRARAALERADLPAALAAGDEAVAAAPAAPEPLLLRAEVRWRLGDVEGAVADVTRAAAADAAVARAHPLRRWLVEALIARGTFQDASGDARAAYRVAEQLVGLAPDLAQSWGLRGVLHTRSGQWTAALADIDLAVALDRSDPHWLFTRAAVRLQQGDLERAEADVTAGLALAPDVKRGLDLRVAIRGGLGDLEGGLADAERLVRLFPGDPQSYVRRAALRMALDQLEGALADLDRLEGMARRPGVDIYRRRATVKLGLGDLEGALADWERVASGSGLSTDEHRRRGMALHAAGRYAEAAADLRRVWELSGEDRFLAPLALSLSSAGEDAEALRLLDEALAAAEDVELLVARALVRREVGRFEEALVDADRALERQPGHVSALAIRGIVLCDLGRLEESLAALDPVVAGAPERTQARLFRARARLGSGDAAGARADCEVLVETLAPGDAVREEAAALLAELGEAR